MSRFIDKAFEMLQPYTPGEQPEPGKYIKLNTNESPFPPSEAVAKAADKTLIDNLRLYSDPEASELKKAIADHFGVQREMVFVSNGSDEILNYAFMIFACGKAAFADITYGFYSVYADLYHIDSKVIPLKDDFTIDPDDYMNLNRFIVIANPNAPTGILLGEDKIRKIIESNSNSVVLIDEAYIDFGGKSLVSLTREYDNLIVCQTFSKSRSLAGARLGFAIASKELIADLEKVKFSTNPYNVNAMTQKLGTAAVKSSSYYDENCRAIIRNRDMTSKKLKEYGFTMTDSYANFLFISHPDIKGKELYQSLRSKGILVRHFDKPRISDYLRVTVGSEPEMNAFLAAVEEILSER